MKKLLAELFRRMRDKTTPDSQYQNLGPEISPTEIPIARQVAVTSPAPDNHTYSPEQPQTLYFQRNGDARKIAYTISGDRNAEKTLLCLPGLLETKNSFALVHD